MLFEIILQDVASQDLLAIFEAFIKGGSGLLTIILWHHIIYNRSNSGWTGARAGNRTQEDLLQFTPLMTAVHRAASVQILLHSL